MVTKDNKDDRKRAEKALEAAGFKVAKVIEASWKSKYWKYYFGFPYLWIRQVFQTESIDVLLTFPQHMFSLRNKKKYQFSLVELIKVLPGSVYVQVCLFMHTLTLVVVVYIQENVSFSKQPSYHFSSVILTLETVRSRDLVR